MTFAWPIALAGLVARPGPRRGCSCSLPASGAATRARFAQSRARRRTSSPRRRAGGGYVADRLALAALVLLIVGVARPHVVRDVARERGDDRARDRHVALDGREGRRSRTASRPPSGGARVPRGGARSYSVGIVSFSTSADPVLPPTTDREAARTALDELRLGTGTAIGAAIDAIRRARARREPGSSEPAEGRSASPAAVLLLSDGAQTAATSAGPAAQRARRLGVPVSTVALGTRRRGGRGAAAGRAEGARGRSRPTCRRCGKWRARPAAVLRRTERRAAPVRVPRARHPPRARPQAGRGDLRLRGGRRGASPRSVARCRRCGSGGPCETPPPLAALLAVAAVAALAGGQAARAADECRGLQTCLPVTGPWVVIPAAARGEASTVVWELRCPLRGLHRRRGRRARERPRDRREHPGRERRARSARRHDRCRRRVHRRLHGRRRTSDLLPAVHRLHPDLGRRRARRDGPPAARRLCSGRSDRPARRPHAPRLRRLGEGRRQVPRRDAFARHEPRVCVSHADRAGRDAPQRGACAQHRCRAAR